MVDDLTPEELHQERLDRLGKLTPDELADEFQENHDLLNELYDLIGEMDGDYVYELDCKINDIYDLALHDSRPVEWGEDVAFLDALIEAKETLEHLVSAFHALQIKLTDVRDHAEEWIEKFTGVNNPDWN